jgi:hypothetical protein
MNLGSQTMSAIATNTVKVVCHQSGEKVSIIAGGWYLPIMMLLLKTIKV